MAALTPMGLKSVKEHAVSTTTPTQSVTGLILAGGAGRRVGGVDKGLMDWRGHALVRQVADRLAPQVGNIIVSCNRNRDRYRALGFETVGDQRAGFNGPLAGFEAAAGHISTPYVAVVPCDTPLLPVTLVTRLLAALDAEGALDVAYASDGSRAHWLCAVLRSEVLHSAGKCLDDGRGAVHAWYARLNTIAVDFSDCAQAFRNLNRGE